MPWDQYFRYNLRCEQTFWHLRLRTFYFLTKAVNFGRMGTQNSTYLFICRFKHVLRWNHAVQRLCRGVGFRVRVGLCAVGNTAAKLTISSSYTLHQAGSVWGNAESVHAHTLFWSSFSSLQEVIRLPFPQISAALYYIKCCATVYEALCI